LTAAYHGYLFRRRTKTFFFKSARLSGEGGTSKQRRLLAMRRIGFTVIGLTILALVDGFVIGLISGIFAQSALAARPPAGDTNDYVWLVSADYAAGEDLPKATQRLSMLQTGTRKLSTLVRQVVRQAESRHDTLRATTLTHLAQALDGGVPAASDEPTTVETETATPVVAEMEPVPTVNQAADSGPVVWVGMGASAGATDGPTATLQPSATALPGSAARTLTATRRPTGSGIVPPAGARVRSGAPSSVDFKIALVRQLTPCENGGNHHLHILVLDQQGNGIPGVPVEMTWPGGSYVDTTGKKVEFNLSLGIDANTTPGYLNYPMFRGKYKARVLAGISEQTDWLSVDIPHDELCVRMDNPVGNSLFHYSYLIVFKKAR
jgi:hypothetical protein